jgi:hypothetical protein
MIYLGILILIGLAIFGISNSRKQGIEEQKNEKSKIPDQPRGFGYKSQWLAIRSDDPKKVAEALDLNTRACNWGYGVSAAQTSKTFITPPIDGWVLVLGYVMDMPDTIEGKHFLEKQSRIFGEVQFFATHRGTEYHAWAKAIEGKMTRLYVFDGHENIITLGEMTEIEEDLKIPEKLPETDEDWANNEIDFPDESTLMEVADAWSVDPTLLDAREDLEGLGLISI